MIATGLVLRTTQDVDVLARLDGIGLVDPEPMPEYLVNAAEATGRTLGLPEVQSYNLHLQVLAQLVVKNVSQYHLYRAC